MKLRDLKEKLATLDDDSEVEDRYGDAITDLTVTVDSRRRVRFETDGQDYKDDLQDESELVNDLRNDLSRLKDRIREVINEHE